MANSSSGDGTRVGRPFLFTDPAKLRMQIQVYFDLCDPHIETRLVGDSFNTQGKLITTNREIMTEQEPYTISGLARHLGVSRQTLLDYRKAEHYSEDIDEDTRQELMDTILNAYQKVEEFNEKMLFKSGIANGVKFSLTNNFGWVDKSVVDSNVRTVEEDLDDLDSDGREEIAEQAAKKLEKDGQGSETSQ